MESSEAQSLKVSQSSANEQSAYKDTHTTTMAENYNESASNVGKTNPLEGYYTVAQDDSRPIDANNIPYIIPEMNESGMTVDPTAMQAAAAINQSLMYQNHGIPADYPYQMFNGANPMYGGIPQYYGGVNMPMNPYYDPYGIINPLSCAPLNLETNKKKSKKFYCC